MSNSFIKRKRHVRIRIDAIVRNLAHDCGVDSWTVKYCLRRFRVEGFSFLTKTLPQLSKTLLRSLEVGYFAIRPQVELDYEGLTSFRWKGRSLCIMQSLLLRIFDHHGLLRSDADPAAIKSIRQFCEYLYKLSLEFDEKALTDAENGFVKVEEEISRFVDSAVWTDAVRKNAYLLFPTVMKALPGDIFEKGPRDGPGSFAGARAGWHRYKAMPNSHIGHMQEQFNAFSGYFKSYPNSPEHLRSVPENKCAEVLFVPKDSRGPRTISREPLHLLRVQMAFFDFMSKALEKDSKHRINFADQQVNRDLARKGSITGVYATLDLKEASDRVRVSFCRRIFRDAPGVRYFINNARSTHCKLPSGDLLELEKLGNMGNGLTFPLLALVVYLSAVTSVAQFHRLPVFEVARQIYVYGDDVICPTEWVWAVNNGLSASGLKVNTSKSFSNGSFRESCGGDYYNGFDVTPVRLRLGGARLKEAKYYKASVPLALEDHGILQLERHCRELRKQGLFCLSEYYYKQIEKAIPLPPVAGSSPVLGRYDLRIYDTQDGVTCFIPAPETDTIASCPYKYLGRFLKSDEMFQTQPYGVIPVPRRVKLVEKVVASHHRAGIPGPEPESIVNARTNYKEVSASITIKNRLRERSSNAAMHLVMTALAFLFGGDSSK